MFSQVATIIARFTRREDGRTAVEYAVGVNLAVLVLITGLTLSGHHGKRTVYKVCDSVSSAYQSIYRFTRHLM